MSDRGMKKWAPYKSLNEQYDHLYQMKEERERIDKPLISNEEAEKINDILLNHNNKKLRISIFKRGRISTIESSIRKIDTFDKLIVLENGQKISLKDIVDIDFCD